MKPLAVGMFLCLMTAGEQPATHEASRTTSGIKPAASQPDQAMLESELEQWQRKFHLESWRIGIRIVRAWELKAETVGHIRWDAEKKTAVIEVLDRRDYDINTTNVGDDLRLTVIHELTHLALSPLRSGESHFDKNQRSIEEGVVNHLSRLLADLHEQINLLRIQNATLTDLLAKRP